MQDEKLPRQLSVKPPVKPDYQFTSFNDWRRHISIQLELIRTSKIRKYGLY